MKALQHRDAMSGVVVHQKIEVRVYSESDVQKDRIERSRKMVANCIPNPSHDFMVELGCGTCDISGPFAVRNIVSAYDCNPEALITAIQRFPALAKVGPIPDQSEPCDILILCEFLEHIPDPLSLVKAWLPLAEQVVISHPLNGDLTGDLSGGEHQWSFNESDFANWFSLGGHKLIEHEVFRMGGYQIILGRGERLL